MTSIGQAGSDHLAGQYGHLAQMAKRDNGP